MKHRFVVVRVRGIVTVVVAVIVMVLALVSDVFTPSYASAALYAPSVHARQVRRVPQDVFTCGAGCQALIAEVQAQADKRWGHGDKADGRLYLHYIQPKRGYSAAVYRDVLGQLGLTGSKKRPSPDDFIVAAELRMLRAIEHMVGATRGQPSEHQVGQMLYLIATLVHAHQDRKHMEGNWTDRDHDGIMSLDHLFLEGHQMYSDIWPCRASEARSVARTTAFLERVRQAMERLGPHGEAVLKRMADFRKLEPAHRYRPDDDMMDQVFPKYDTNDHGYQGNGSLRLGAVWRDRGNALVGEAGWRWHVFLGASRPRLDLGLHVGGSTDFDTEHRVHGSIGFMASEYKGFIAAGVALTAGASVADPLFERPLLDGGLLDGARAFWAVVPTLEVFEGSLVIQAHRVVYRDARATEWQFSTQLDLLSLARLAGVKR